MIPRVAIGFRAFQMILLMTVCILAECTSVPWARAGSDGPSTNAPQACCLLVDDPLNSWSWTSINARRVESGGRFVQSEGYWVTRGQSDQIVYYLGPTDNPTKISSGRMEVEVSNFDPPAIFERGVNGNLPNEKYHFMAAGNSGRLDHHSDVLDDAGWSLHAQPCPGDQHDPEDLKILAYWVGAAGPGAGTEQEEFRFNPRGSLNWNRSKWYKIAVTWAPDGAGHTVIRVYRDSGNGESMILSSPLNTDSANRAQEVSSSGDCSGGNCPGCSGAQLDFKIGGLYAFVIGGDNTHWCDCRADHGVRHNTLVGVRYRNLKIWSYD